MKTLLALALIILLPTIASAHVKWFVEPIRAEETLSNASGLFTTIGLIVCLAAVVAAIMLSRYTPHPPLPMRQWVEKNQQAVRRIVLILIGAWLIAMSYQGHLLAPTFDISTTFTRILEMTAIIVGILLVGGFFYRFAAIMLGILWLGIGATFGWLPLFETAELAGIAIWLWLTSMHPYATPALRIGTGLSLVILALGEKIIAPAWSIAFLQTYHWNFATSFGLSDTLFILATGFIELLFGLLLTLGVCTRLVTLAVASVMITTAILLGPSEIVGHLPFFAIGLWLICYGGGKRLTLSRSTR